MTISIIRFLQFGSPHGLSGQAQFIAAERKEVWVNIGQVLLPGRVFARDMIKHGFPVLMYSIKWTPENVRPCGKLSCDSRSIF
jgi:hypothetical protein